MSTAISASLASASQGTGAAHPIQPATPVSKAPTAASSTALASDTVKLSLSAQVRLLHHQGVSPTQIATRLGISLKQITNYIPGYTAATSAAPVKTAPTPKIADTDGDSATEAKAIVTTAPPAQASAKPVAATPQPKAPVEATAAGKVAVPVTK